MTIIKTGDFILIKSVSSRSQKFVIALVIKSHLSVWLAPQQPNIWMTTVLYNLIISYPADTAISETWKKILRSWNNNTCWWTEFKIFPSWETPSGFIKKLSTSPLTWRWIARWCLLCLEFYDLGHTHASVGRHYRQHGDWDRHRLYTEGGGKMEQQKDEVQLYLRPKTASFGRVVPALLWFLRTWE